MEITLASSDQDLKQIIVLQKANHVAGLTTEQKAAQGYVTVQHDFDLLKMMNTAAPQIIAKDNERVVGYALVMFEKFSEMIPVLKPMFDLFGSLHYKGQPLHAYRYYVMGQICIDEAYRGKGIFNDLYLKHKEIYSDRYDFCLTEVSTGNQRSMRAHERVGFKILHTFRDQTDEWNILLWNWK